MPRVSREQTAANRKTIEDVSARLFRQQGIDGVSVADLMAAAGLTHGGFYGHFASKDALAGIACEHAFKQSREQREKWRAATATPAASTTAFLQRYLSVRHRDDPGGGCPAAALAVDVARQPQDVPVRQAYLAGIRSMTAALQALAPGDDPQRQRGDALATMATLVGALVLSRATRGDPISGEILAAALAALNGPDRPEA